MHLKVPHVLKEVRLLVVHAGHAPQVLQSPELASLEDELQERHESAVGAVLPVPQAQLDRLHQELLHHKVELFLALAARYPLELDGNSMDFEKRARGTK